MILHVTAKTITIGICIIFSSCPINLFYILKVNLTITEFTAHEVSRHIKNNTKGGDHIRGGVLVGSKGGYQIIRINFLNSEKKNIDALFSIFMCSDIPLETT